jgi:hypothetical protein
MILKVVAKSQAGLFPAERGSEDEGRELCGGLGWV